MIDKKLKIAVICDNKQDFISYITSLKYINSKYITSRKNDKYDYIYVSEDSYPHGIEFDDMIDLRAVTQTIITRMKPKWLKEHKWFRRVYEI